MGFWVCDSVEFGMRKSGLLSRMYCGTVLLSGIALLGGLDGDSALILYVWSGG
jgi:hypothetical protein